jgi:hypothetical protein
MLKAIVTVMDENDRILHENKLIFETDAIPVGLGVRHDFNFSVVTADEELIRESLMEREEKRNGQG